MTARVSKSDLAKADLMEIWQYVARNNEPAADRLLDRIEERCRLLAEPSLNLGYGPI